jgi:hypothetical protein
MRKRLSLLAATAATALTVAVSLVAAQPAAAAASNPPTAMAIGPFLMKMRHTGMCVEVPGSSTANAAQLQQAPCVGVTGAPNQRWYWIRDYSNGPFFWRNEATGKCMDVATRPRSLPGAIVIQWDCEEAGANTAWTTQKWQNLEVNPVARALAVWIARSQGGYVTAMGTHAGAPVQLARAGGGIPATWQQFTLI